MVRRKRKLNFRVHRHKHVAGVAVAVERVLGVRGHAVLRCLHVGFQEVKKNK